MGHLPRRHFVVAAMASTPLALPTMHVSRGASLLGHNIAVPTRIDDCAWQRLRERDDRQRADRELALLTIRLRWRERVRRRLAWWGWAWREIVWPAIRRRRDPHRCAVLLWWWLLLSGFAW